MSAMDQERQPAQSKLKFEIYRRLITSSDFWLPLRLRRLLQFNRLRSLREAQRPQLGGAVNRGLLIPLIIGHCSAAFIRLRNPSCQQSCSTRLCLVAISKRGHKWVMSSIEELLDLPLCRGGGRNRHRLQRIGRLKVIHA